MMARRQSCGLVVLIHVQRRFWHLHFCPSIHYHAAIMLNDSSCATTTIRHPFSAWKTGRFGDVFKKFVWLLCILPCLVVLAWLPSRLLGATQYSRDRIFSSTLIATLEDGSQYVLKPVAVLEEKITPASTSEGPVPDFTTAFSFWTASTDTSKSNEGPLTTLSFTVNRTMVCLYRTTDAQLPPSGETTCRVRLDESFLLGDFFSGDYSWADGTRVYVSIPKENPISRRKLVTTTVPAAVAAPLPVSASGGAAFRRNPHKPRRPLFDRLRPIVRLSGFGILVGLQIFLFVAYWNGQVAPSAVGKLYTNILHGGEVWRALSGSTAHFDLWHIGLNMSAFYQLSEVLADRFPPFAYLGLNLSLMALVTACWVGLQYAWLVFQSRRASGGDSGTTATVSSAPTVGYSGVLFALSTMVTLQRSRSCPIPLVESICFPTVSLCGLRWSVSPFLQLGLVQVILPRVSFWGHLAGILVGYAYTWGLLPAHWTTFPSLVWPALHLSYLILKDRGSGGRRLGSVTLQAIRSTPGMGVAVLSWFASLVVQGWANALVWSYGVTIVFWGSAHLTGDVVWKRAYCVYAILLVATLSAAVGAWALTSTVSLTNIGVTVILMQVVTLLAGVVVMVDDVMPAEGIFYHTVGRAVLQPLSHLLAFQAAATQPHSSSERGLNFPGEGHRLREVTVAETELV
jgi:membrane associated rhomboid family serine protease